MDKMDYCVLRATVFLMVLETINIKVNSRAHVMTVSRKACRNRLIKSPSNSDGRGKRKEISLGGKLMEVLIFFFLLKELSAIWVVKFCWMLEGSFFYNMSSAFTRTKPLSSIAKQNQFWGSKWELPWVQILFCANTNEIRVLESSLLFPLTKPLCAQNSS